MTTAPMVCENGETDRAYCENRTASTPPTYPRSAFLTMVTMASIPSCTVQYCLPVSPSAESLSLCESFGRGHA